MNMKENKENGLKEIIYIPCRIRSSYLPAILMKLGEFESNTECRKFIREKGVLVNDGVVNVPSVELKRKHKYKIFVNNVGYEVNIL